MSSRISQTSPAVGCVGLAEFACPTCATYNCNDMSYRTVSHTADVRIVVTATTMPELFSEALRGLMNILKEKPVIARQAQGAPEAHQPVKRTVHVSAEDSTSLLVNFLNEALALAYTNKKLYPRAVFAQFSDTSLRAELEGVPVEKFNKDVKAVTYHEANVVQEPSGKWRTNLILDI